MSLKAGSLLGMCVCVCVLWGSCGSPGLHLPLMWVLAPHLCHPPLPSPHLQHSALSSLSFLLQGPLYVCRGDFPDGYQRWHKPRCFLCRLPPPPNGRRAGCPWPVPSALLFLSCSDGPRARTSLPQQMFPGGRCQPPLLAGPFYFHGTRWFPLPGVRLGVVSGDKAEKIHSVHETDTSHC